MNQRGRLFLVSCAVTMGLAGCSTTPDSGGNEALGIARFEVQETADRSTIVGLDDADQVVARVDLIHGRFTLTGQFRDDYDTATVEGRKLDVKVGGKTLTYETAGFDPVMHMPAHPLGTEGLGTFLDDPHVKPLLDRWQLGFASSSDGETAYTYGITQGTSQYDCLTNIPTTECGTARGFNIGTCGGGVAPYQAYRVTRTTPTYTYDEYVVDQYCPAGSGGQSTPWVAYKACPTTGTGAQTGSCGTTGATSACKGCATYNAEWSGEVRTSQSGLNYCALDNAEAASCRAANSGQYCKQFDGQTMPGQCGCGGECVCYGHAWTCY
jgi:hypothetical protein